MNPFLTKISLNQREQIERKEKKYVNKNNAWEEMFL